MQAKKIKYNVIGLTETRQRHPLNAVYETGDELFVGICDSGGVGGVGVLLNTSMAKNIDSFEQLGNGHHPLELAIPQALLPTLDVRVTLWSVL
ncbi:hypothetical protein NECAME_16166 [Necator americanus]|uniref:Uncharacterized protein n=1 Tax=Necator americanus TaxID=51031 RepID=W2U067_NECAM|nr:hypothetical protein NECAME_16166 [Necator americanus]ETN86731.1 hypothetical protein NECAME_16166 [Necator americanus]